jgi:hypothetical protein
MSCFLNRRFQTGSMTLDIATVENDMGLKGEMSLGVILSPDSVGVGGKVNRDADSFGGMGAGNDAETDNAVPVAGSVSLAPVCEDAAACCVVAENESDARRKVVARLREERSASPICGVP